jgi:hypothetical protein
MGSVRRASAAAVKLQQELAEGSRSSSCCARFFSALRLLNVLGACGIAGTAVTIAVMAGVEVARATEACAEDDSQTDCVDTGFRIASYIVVALALLVCSAITVATDGCRCRCVARFFGFMVGARAGRARGTDARARAPARRARRRARSPPTLRARDRRAPPLSAPPSAQALNVFKGLFSFFCGLLVAWLGRVYEREEGTASARAAGLALFVVGMVNGGVGLLYIFFGACNCARAPAPRARAAPRRLAASPPRRLAASPPRRLAARDGAPRLPAAARLRRAPGSRVGRHRPRSAQEGVPRLPHRARHVPRGREPRGEGGEAQAARGGRNLHDRGVRHNRS